MAPIPPRVGELVHKVTVFFIIPTMWTRWFVFRGWKELWQYPSYNDEINEYTHIWPPQRQQLHVPPVSEGYPTHSFTRYGFDLSRD